MRKKYYRRKEYAYFNDISGAVSGILLLGALYFSSLYFLKKEWFWFQVNHYIFPTLGVLAIAVGAYIFFLFQKSKRQRRHFEKILQQITERDFENNLNRFIDGYGKADKTNSWEHGGYTFDWEQLKYFREQLIQNKIDISTKDHGELTELLRYFIDKKEKTYMSEFLQTKTVHNLSELSERGDDFELLVVRLYDAMGYASKRIGGHGDQGGDVLASKNGENILIQAKCYQGTVGNEAVQQAATARLHYGCTRSVVVTTSSFTHEAIALAKSNSVELIDGKELKQKLLKHLGEMWQ